MSFKRFIVMFFSVVALSLCLQSCMSTQAKLDSAQQSMAEKNYSQAVDMLKPMAEDGNAEAQYALAYLYYYGMGVTEDSVQARYWMTKSADQGNTSAMQALQLINMSRTTASPSLQVASAIVQQPAGSRKTKSRAKK